MALDGIFLYSLICELKDKLMYGKVDKIYQPENDEISLSIRANKINYKLLISANATYPKIHLTNINKSNPIEAPMFCMVLRKYLSASKIIDIRQLNTDRILIIDFESTDELGFNSIYSLIIEIMGRHSNITLVRKRDNIIMDCIKHITPDINTYRSLYPGIPYTYPPPSNKLNPFNFSLNEIKKFIKDNSISYNDSFFLKIFTGVSKSLSRELLYRYYLINNDFNNNNIDIIYDFTKSIFDEIKNKYFDFAYYVKDEKLKDFHCIKFEHLADYSMVCYDSPSFLLEDYYFEKDKSDRIKSKSSNLQKIINTNINRCKKKLKIQNKTLKESKNKDKYRLYGELLTANIYAVKKGMNEINVLNYYNEEEEEYINIKLKKSKTPSQNIEMYFKKYNKLKKAEKAASEQIKYTKDELDYLESVLTNIKNAESPEVIEEIKTELIECSYIKFNKKNRNKNNKKKKKPLHFLSSDEIDIYVGRNNFENDYLTLKFADKNDIWLHTKNIPGSHVIIKKFDEIPNRTLEEAANIAAYYSKSKNSSNVPVDYTEIKNVKKPSGAKPGMVIYYTNKTLFVNPKKPNLKLIDN